MSGNYCFIADLSTLQIAQARAAKIKLFDYWLGTSHGVLVSENAANQLIDCLSLRVIQRTATAEAGVSILVVKSTVLTPPAAPAATPTATGKIIRFDTNSWPWYISTKPVREILRKTLLPVIPQQKIQVSYPGGAKKHSTAANIFHVRIFATPQLPAKISPLGKRASVWWGRNIGTDRSLMFTPSGCGVAIVDPKSGLTAAELVQGNNLYICLDLSGGPDELFVLEQICIAAAATLAGQTIPCVPPAPEPTTDRDLYIALCQKWRQQTTHAVRHHADELRLRVNLLQEQLTQAVRELTRVEQAEIDQHITEQERQKNFGIEYDRLLAIDQVESVTVGDDVITVFTKVLCCTDPRTDVTHEIGKFRIEIYPSGRNDGVRWFNLTRQVTGWQYSQQAPHIWNDGRACLGNMAEIIPELVGRRDFVPLATMAIAFVESVNTADRAGSSISNWPVAKRS